MLEVYEVKYESSFGIEEVEIVESQEELIALLKSIHLFDGEILEVTKIKVLDHK